MKTYSFSIAVLAIMTLCPSTSIADEVDNGGLRGTVNDDSGRPAVGATIVIVSPSLKDQIIEFTNVRGTYSIASLPPGELHIFVYYSEASTHSRVHIMPGKIVVKNFVLATRASEVIEVRSPIVDYKTLQPGRILTEEITENIPVGRTFGTLLDLAAGAHLDEYGLAHGGASSAENVYNIEGLNTTDPVYGTQDTDLPNEFIRTTEIINGAYKAEYGRSAGSVVNVITKSGTNQFHGSVFASLTPGALQAGGGEPPSGKWTSVIDAISEVDYDISVGAEVAGPIVKDWLWFHLGLSQTFTQHSIHRVVSMQTDEDQDGYKDLDDTGSVVLREVARSIRDVNSANRFFTAKIHGGSPAHHGTITFFGNSSNGDSYRSIIGEESAGRIRGKIGVQDLSLKWTSKFNNNKTQIDALIGYHRSWDQIAPGSPDGDTPYYGIRLLTSLEQYSSYEIEFGGAFPPECLDGGIDDPYPNITNCPVKNYAIGGIGFYESEIKERLPAMLSLTHRFRLQGRHTLKFGLDVESLHYERRANFSGGVRYFYQGVTGLWSIDRYVHFNENSANDDDRTTTIPASNHAAYIQDEWQIVPNLLLNFGLRWEAQSLHRPKETIGVTLPSTGNTLPSTGNTIGEKPIYINNMFAPRFGITYDPAKNGRTSLHLHWGRFYESLPLALNAFAFFDGSIYRQSRYQAEACFPTSSPEGTTMTTICTPADESIRVSEFLIGEEEPLIADGLRGPYTDELVVGAAYETLYGLKLAARYTRRKLGRVIEDISSDSLWLIGNPGEGDELRIQNIRLEAEREREAGNIVLANKLELEALQLDRAAKLDRPIRLYQALQLIIEKRFWKKLLTSASYTYSQTFGNYPGIFEPTGAEIEPHFTTMYDFPGSMVNRTGFLPSDRTHLFQLDGFYRLDLNKSNGLIIGLKLRVQSGVPVNILSSNRYGSGTVYLLPRGSGGRTPWDFQSDIRLQYTCEITNRIKIKGYLDIFNIFNKRTVTELDELYTFRDTPPIINGDMSDLAHLKQADNNRIIRPDPSFGNGRMFAGARSVHTGIRIEF